MVADVRSAGSIGATLVVVLTLTFPAGVSEVLVRMRMVTSAVRLLAVRRAPTHTETVLNGKGKGRI